MIILTFQKHEKLPYFFERTHSAADIGRQKPTTIAQSKTYLQSTSFFVNIFDLQLKKPVVQHLHSTIIVATV